MARKFTPKRWTSLIVVGTAAGLTQAIPTHAAFDGGILAVSAPPWISLASGEGGEGGEGGIVQGAPPDVAYLTRLGLVEGHLIAAAYMHARGLTDEAIGMSGHPEAEMMDEVRESLSAYGAADFTKALGAVGEVMADGGDKAQIEQALSALQAAITQAEAVGHIPVKARFETMTALARAAAHEYTRSIDSGVVQDVFAYHESLGFLVAADRMAQELIATQDQAVVEAAQRIREVLAQAIAEYGDTASEELAIGDPSVLHGVAARVELAGLKVD